VSTKHEVIELTKAIALSVEFSEPNATTATQAEIDESYRQRQQEMAAEKQRVKDERNARLLAQAEIAWQEHIRDGLKASLVEAVKRLSESSVSQSNAEAARRYNRLLKKRVERRIARLEAEIEAGLALMAYNRQVLAQKASEQADSEAELVRAGLIATFGKVPTPKDVIPLGITR
jgi:small-conductance mechanosensitive channel